MYLFEGCNGQANNRLGMFAVWRHKATEANLHDDDQAAVFSPAKSGIPAITLIAN